MYFRAEVMSNEKLFKWVLEIVIISMTVET